jgi:hypothetical protein
MCCLEKFIVQLSVIAQTATARPATLPFAMPAQTCLPTAMPCPACPKCDNADTEWFITIASPLTGTPYCHCPACGHVWKAPRPGGATTADILTVHFAALLAVRDFGRPYQGPCELSDVIADRNNTMFTITFNDLRSEATRPLFDVLVDGQEHATAAAVREYVIRKIQSYVATHPI